MEQKENQEIVVKPKRLVYLDILNIIAMIQVVDLHVNGIVHSHPEIRAWNTSLIVKVLFYWGVPLYLMISGANLMNYRSKYDTKTFFKKRFIKVVIPFLFWAMVMFAYRLKKNLFHTYHSFAEFINAFLSNEEQSTYYFIFEILGLYLTMPFLSLLTEEKHRKTLWFTIALYVIFNATLPYILLFFKIYYNYAFSVRIGGFVIYVILGYLLSTQTLKKKEKIILYISTILGIVWRYAITFYLSKKHGVVFGDIWSYKTWYAFLGAAAIFVFVKDSKIVKKLEDKPRLQKILASVASCSFGIYLIHVPIMEALVKFLKINVYTWQYRTFGILAVYFITLIPILIMKKIPIVKKLVP